MSVTLGHLRLRRRSILFRRLLRRVTRRAEIVYLRQKIYEKEAMNDRVSISKTRVLAPNEHIVIMRYQVCYRTHNTKLEIAAFAEKKKQQNATPSIKAYHF